MSLSGPKSSRSAEPNTDSTRMRHRWQYAASCD